MIGYFVAALAGFGVGYFGHDSIKAGFDRVKLERAKQIAAQQGVPVEVVLANLAAQEEARKAPQVMQPPPQRQTQYQAAQNPSLNAQTQELAGREPAPMNQAIIINKDELEEAVAQALNTTLSTSIREVVTKLQEEEDAEEGGK